MKETLNRARGTEKERLFVRMAINMTEIGQATNTKAKESINFKMDEFIQESSKIISLMAMEP